ncbi:MAG: methyl-accepting chemotaxis protein [Planctomycetota bacterium]
MSSLTASRRDGRCVARFEAAFASLCARVDRGMAMLLGALTATCMLLAWTYAPYAWQGSDYQLHEHLIASLLISGGSTLFVVRLLKQHAGRALTRHVVAVSVMLNSALLVHLCGGRIETHFSVFVGLAFLAAYRDSKVMLTGMVTVAGEHLLRGVMLPESIFGVADPNLIRVLEHAMYVVFEVAVLILVCRMSIGEMRHSCQLLIAAEDAHQAAEDARREQANKVAEARRQASERVRSILEQFQTIGNCIEENTQQAQQMQEISATSQAHAQSGGEVLAETVQHLQDLAKRVQASRPSIAALVDSGKHISEVTATISSVAFQTNLLALNAAVEAARAGEHGKGFAVVADEVRALATRTADATRRIEELVDNVRSRSTELDATTQSANDEACRGLKQIDSAEASIDAIRRSAAELSDVMGAAVEANSILGQRSEHMQRDVEALLD